MKNVKSNIALDKKLDTLDDGNIHFLLALRCSVITAPRKRIHHLRSSISHHLEQNAAKESVVVS